MTDRNVFVLRGAQVKLGTVTVLDGVDFRLDRREFVALLGTNGSGKTTLVRALLGLTPLSAGAREFFGRPARHFREWFRIGYVPQRTTIAAGTAASVTEVVMSGRVSRSSVGRRYAEVDRKAAARALDSMNLGELRERSVSGLSVGQRQRVLIARALAAEPEILVLDEPTSGIDLRSQDLLAGCLRGFSQAGGTVLVVAHSLGPLEELVAREVVLHAGQVSYDGPHHPHHVHADHVHHFEDPDEGLAPIRGSRTGGWNV